jgi:hypothetical protein
MADGNNNDDGEVRTGGIKDFIAHTNMIGNVIAAAASQKNSFEPLPFSNSSLFEDNYGNFFFAQLCYYVQLN